MCSKEQNSMPGSRASDSDIIDAVDRTLAILECFSTDRPELGISEISRELGIHKSSVFRSLASLEARGLVKKDERTRRYMVGPKILKPAGAYLGTVDLHGIVRPFMEELGAASKETVSLYVPAGDRCVCIDRLESPMEVRRVIRVGDQVPLYSGSSGKAVLAHLPEPLREELLRQLESNPPLLPAPLDVGELVAQLPQIREQGFVISHAERVSQVSSVSAPILDATGSVVAAITVSGPSIRFTEARVQEYVRMVTEAAEEASRRLGYGLYGKP
jgi:IclR family transcriptional regulator, KDG regulon repressor